MPEAESHWCLESSVLPRWTESSNSRAERLGQRSRRRGPGSQGLKAAKSHNRSEACHFVVTRRMLKAEMNYFFQVDKPVGPAPRLATHQPSSKQRSWKETTRLPIRQHRFTMLDAFSVRSGQFTVKCSAEDKKTDMD